MKIYCRACGQRCFPVCSGEDPKMLVFVSDCCGYTMSEDPVTPCCQICGEPAHVDDPPDTLQEIVGIMACAKCREKRSRNLLMMEEYRKRHKP